MKELVAVANGCVELWQSGKKQSIHVDVEITSYSGDDFGIRIYLPKKSSINIKNMLGIKLVENGRSWISLTFDNSTSIQFVYGRGLVPPSDLSAA
jgi:hypothetical protein